MNSNPHWDEEQSNFRFNIFADGCTIIHLPTGKKIGGMFNTIAEAAAYLNALTGWLGVAPLRESHATRDSRRLLAAVLYRSTNRASHNQETPHD